MLKRLWTWISRERNRRTLAWIGGGLAIAMGALWKLHTYEPPPKASAVADAPVKVDEPAHPPPAVQTATAESGGIAINAEGNANVSVQQSKH